MLFPNTGLMKSPQKFTKESHVWKDSKWLYIIFVANKVGSSKQINATPSKTKGETATILNDINALEYQIAHSEEMTRKISRINPRKLRFFANKGNHFKSICSPHLPVCSSDTLEVRGLPMSLSTTLSSPLPEPSPSLRPPPVGCSLWDILGQWCYFSAPGLRQSGTGCRQRGRNLARWAAPELSCCDLIYYCSSLAFHRKKLSFAVLIVCILEAYGI
jgi:hypothetical protein